MFQFHSAIRLSEIMLKRKAEKQAEKEDKRWIDKNVPRLAYSRAK